MIALYYPKMYTLKIIVLELETELFNSFSLEILSALNHLEREMDAI